MLGVASSSQSDVVILLGVNFAVIDMKTRCITNVVHTMGRVLLTMSLFVISPFAYAEEVRLYGEYVYGYPVSQLVNESETYDCSDDVGSGYWICKDEEKFVNHDVSILFEIQKDVVVSVTLLTELSDQAYADFFAAMMSKFQLVLLSDGESSYDLLHNSKSKNRNTIAQEMGEFEREALQRSSITYAFIEESDANSLKGFSSVTELVALVDSSRRFVDLRITNDGETAYLSVFFYLPGKRMDVLKESINKEFDDF